MHIRKRRNRDRRGIAMLLVLVSLGMAVILTSAYVTSRDNSATIGDNVASSSAARCAAMAGLDLSVAILETETQWRTLHTNGLLLDDFDLDGTAVDVELVDTLTGTPPDETTTYVRIIVTAMEDGVEQGVAATAHVPLQTGEGGVVDVDLSEFAIFTRDYIDLNGNSTVTRWANAPESGNGERIAFGTRSTALNSVDISSGVATIDTDLYHGPEASLGLLNNLSSTLLNKIALQDSVPLPDAPSAGVAVPSGGSYPNQYLNGQNRTINTPQRWSFAQIQGGSQLRLEGEMTIVSEGSFVIQSDSRLIIDGDVKLVVFGAVAIDDGGIELEPGASLQLYVGHMLHLSDGYIGDLRVDPNVRDSSGSAAWMDPERIQIFGMKESEMIYAYNDSDYWELTANSVMKASIYAPLRRMKIKDFSALYGRLAARSLDMNNDGAIFYDHGLNDGFGFINTSSPLYDSEGHLKSDFASISSLDFSILQLIADASGVAIDSAGTLVGDVTNSSTPPPPGDPTPRTVEVEYDVTFLGTDIAEWEG